MSVSRARRGLGLEEKLLTFFGLYAPSA